MHNKPVHLTFQILQKNCHFGVIYVQTVIVQPIISIAEHNVRLMKIEICYLLPVLYLFQR